MRNLPKANPTAHINDKSAMEEMSTLPSNNPLKKSITNLTLFVEPGI